MLDTSPGIINSSGWPTLLVQGLVVLPDVNGVIWAWDIETGELAWESTFDPGAGYTAEGESKDGPRTITFGNFAATAWHGYIVIINDDAELQVLNPENGETVISYNLMSTNPDIFQSFESVPRAIYSVPSHIVLFTDVSSSNGQHSKAVALDPLTGNIAWSQQFEGFIGAPSVSDDGSMTINSGYWHQGNWFLQLLGQPGYSTNQFFWYDGETGMEILSTGRVKTEQRFNFPVTNGEYACIITLDENSELICFDRLGTRHFIDIELRDWMVFEEGILYIPAEDGLYRVELP